jgi:hypothetical protein
MPVEVDQQQPSVDPYAPLLWLVCNKLHQGSSLKDLVLKHRWKRKRAQAVAVAEAAETEPVTGSPADVPAAASAVQQD